MSSRAQAQTILSVLPPFVTSVGLFVNPAVDFLAEVLRQCPLDLLQFHGDESAADCRHGRPYIKAIRARPGVDLLAVAQHYPDARGFLLDSYDPEQAGGTGQTFDWSRIPAAMPAPLILAGGLNPANVAEALRRVGPYAVDVSSGVESAPGIKDAALLRAFIDNARNMDASLRLT